MLLGVCADHDINTRAGPSRDAIEWRRRDDTPVDHWLPGQHVSHYLITPSLRVRMPHEIGHQLSLRRKHTINRNRHDRLSGRCDAKLCGKVLAYPLRSRGACHMLSRPTLGNGSPEQPLGVGHGKQHVDAHRTGRLAKDGDVAGGATEGSDVLLNPVEGGNLVKQAAVSAFLAQIEEALGANAVGNAHTDDAVAGKPTS